MQIVVVKCATERSFIEATRRPCCYLNGGMRALGQSSTVIYTNKTIKEALGVQDKLLKKYRDDGLLSFHQVGDKFWYTYDDVQQFLSKHYYPAFATAS